MNLATALAVISVIFPSSSQPLYSDRAQQHCEQWDLTKQDADQDTLETLKSAVDIWSNSIQETIQDRFSNAYGVLRLRDRVVTRGNVSGSSRSLVPIRSRPVETPGHGRVHQDQSNNDPVLGALLTDPIMDIDDPLDLYPGSGPMDIFEGWDGYDADSLFIPHTLDPMLDSQIEPEPAPGNLGHQPDDGYESSGKCTTDPQTPTVDSDAELVSATGPGHPITQLDDGYGSGNDSTIDVPSQVIGLQDPTVHSDEVITFPNLVDNDFDPNLSSVSAGMDTHDHQPAEIGADAVTRSCSADLISGDSDYVGHYWNDQFVGEVEETDHIGDLAMLFGRSPHLYPSNAPTVDAPSRDPLDPSDIKVMDSYVESACEGGFLPLYPRSSVRMSSAELHQLLEPLAQGTPLTKDLIYNLLRALIPTLMILDSDPEAWGAHLDEWEAQLNEPDAHDQAEDELSAVLETSPAFTLILASKQKRDVLVIGGETVPATYKAIFESHGFGIRLNPEQLPLQLEHTLGLVYMAVHCTVNSLTFTSARDLRMDLIKILLNSYQRMDGVLQQLGIRDDQRTRLRPISRAKIPSSGLPAPELAHELYDPDIKSIRQGARGRKILRMLQCIKEVGSVRILEALKVAASQPRESLPTEGPSYLLQIHHYLDTRGASSHLDVARTRFVKVCYFSAFQSAVDTLKEKKRLSRIEKKLMSKRLVDTPETDWICINYPSIDHTKALSANLIVQESIVGGIHRQYGGCTDIIKEHLKRYLVEGATLNLILHRLEPAHLVLFPGDQHWDPCLSYKSLEDAAIKAKLEKPIKVKDIDTLTEIEANWFGQAMQVLRPELYAPSAIPVATALLGLPSDADGRLQERDPGCYSAKPLDFLA